MLMARSPSCCEAQFCIREKFAAIVLFGSVIPWSHSLTVLCSMQHTCRHHPYTLHSAAFVNVLCMFRCQSTPLGHHCIMAVSSRPPSSQSVRTILMTCSTAASSVLFVADWRLVHIRHPQLSDSTMICCVLKLLCVSSQNQQHVDVSLHLPTSLLTCRPWHVSKRPGLLNSTRCRHIQQH